MEKGFVPVDQLKLGMHVLRADGQSGVISGWKMVPGVKLMYNLEVAQDHTFTVGADEWVVHNCGGGDPENVFLPQNRYPEAAANIRDSVEGGQPEVLHTDPASANANRRASLTGYDRIPGYDRDEYPPAASQEGGAGTNVRYINPSDNRGAGSFLQKQLAGLPPGTPYIINIIDEWLF